MFGNTENKHAVPHRISIAPSHSVVTDFVSNNNPDIRLL